MKNKPRLLITGWSGFLGSNLLPLIESKYQIIKFKGDISDYHNVYKQVDENLNKVVHLAGIIAGNDKDMIKVNVLGTLNLLEALKEKSPSKLDFFLAIGSASEFHPATKPIKENHPKLATNMYGKTKSMGADLIESWFKYTQIPTVILRPFNIIGPNQPFRMLPKKLALFFSSSLKKVRIENVNVRAVRDWVDVADVALAIDSILDKETNFGFKALNFGKGNGVTNLQLIETFSKVWQKDFEYSDSNFPTDSLICDNQNFRNFLPDFSFKYELIDSVKRIKETV